MFTKKYHTKKMSLYLLRQSYTDRVQASSHHLHIIAALQPSVLKPSGFRLLEKRSPGYEPLQSFTFFTLHCCCCCTEYSWADIRADELYVSCTGYTVRVLPPVNSQETLLLFHSWNTTSCCSNFHSAALLFCSFEGSHTLWSSLVHVVGSTSIWTTSPHLAYCFTQYAMDAPVHRKEHIIRTSIIIPGRLGFILIHDECIVSLVYA